MTGEVTWAQFRRHAAGLAARAERLFDASGVVLVGTLRRDGSPRISPVEPLIVGDELYLGMMWRSLKARDLQRDPRCTLHSSIADRHARDGELKLHGQSIEVLDLEERHRYGEALLARIGWRPAEPAFHLFAVRVHSAAHFVTEETTRTLTLWREGEPVRTLRQTVDGRLEPLPAPTAPGAS